MDYLASDKVGSTFRTRRGQKSSQKPLSLSDKLFYKIGEVSHLTGLESYIIRYWETEFPMLHPKKSRGGQRIYQKKDLETVFKIKQMLYERGYTIAGARKALGRRGLSSNADPQDLLIKLRADLSDILNLVSS